MTRTGARVLGAALVVAIAAAGSWVWLRRPPSEGSTAAAVIYHCPMHPRVVSDRPGECPICHMTLVPATAPHAGRTIYRSTMNPSETSDRPGKDSMGMDMVAVQVDESVTGLAAIRIPDERRRLIGVKTSEVARRPFVRAIRAPGRVTADETRLREIQTKVAGYVEQLFVGATGQSIRRGEPLLSIYSPELLAAQQEYLVALEARRRTAGSSIPSVAASGDDLVVSSRRRLELLDASEDQLRRLETSGQAERSVVLHAPISGTVLRRMVTQGQRVEPGTPLLALADLSRVWVIAAIYEHETPFVRAGQRAAVAFPQAGGRREGSVDFVYPVLDPTSRTLQVRIPLGNADGALKPEMFAEVELEADLGSRLAVPSSAVMDTGTRSVVFVEKEGGLYEPRDVRTGLRLPDAIEVLEGLSEGERVVTSANFFVDSESKLKSVLAAP